MKKARFLLSFVFLLFTSGLALAEEGYDYEEGSAVVMEEGDTSREESQIDVFHEDTGSFDTEIVESSHGGEAETFDQDTGEERTYEE